MVKRMIEMRGEIYVPNDPGEREKSAQQNRNSAKDGTRCRADWEAELAAAGMTVDDEPELERESDERGWMSRWGVVFTSCGLYAYSHRSAGYLESGERHGETHDRDDTVCYVEDNTLGLPGHAYSETSSPPPPTVVPESDETRRWACYACPYSLSSEERVDWKPRHNHLQDRKDHVGTRAGWNKHCLEQLTMASCATAYACPQIVASKTSKSERLEKRGFVLRLARLLIRRRLV